MCTEFTLSEIEAATNKWDPANLLGEGGYAVVYRGVSSKGQKWAVKRAKLMTNDFEKEVGQRVEQVRACMVHLCSHAHAHAHILTHTQT